MKVKVPNPVQIGGYKYSVCYKEGLLIEDQASGVAHHRREEIQIDPLLGKQDRDTTFMHEVNEIIKRVYSCDITHSDLDRMANGNSEFLFNNLGIDLDWSDIK